MCSEGSCGVYLLVWVHCVAVVPSCCSSKGPVLLMRLYSTIQNWRWTNQWKQSLQSPRRRNQCLSGAPFKICSWKKNQKRKGGKLTLFSRWEHDFFPLMHTLSLVVLCIICFIFQGDFCSWNVVEICVSVCFLCYVCCASLFCAYGFCNIADKCVSKLYPISGCCLLLLCCARFPLKGGHGCMVPSLCVESQGCHLISLSYLLFFCLVLFLFLSYHFSVNSFKLSDAGFWHSHWLLELC